MSRRSRRENSTSQSKKQNKLHVIEPQSTSTTTDVVKRVYVCERSAAKFRNHCIGWLQMIPLQFTSWVIIIIMDKTLSSKMNRGQ